MTGRWIDWMKFAVQTRSSLWTGTNVIFLLPCILPPLYFFIFYFSASDTGVFLKTEIQTWNFYLKHFFKSSLTFFFPFPWIFLKKRRKEDYNIFFTKPSGIFMKHNQLLSPDLKGYFRNKGKAEMRDLWNLFWSFSKGISRPRITSSVHPLCTSHPWPEPH